jgi:hypothetical protein
MNSNSQREKSPLLISNYTVDMTQRYSWVRTVRLQIYFGSHFYCLNDDSTQRALTSKHLDTRVLLYRGQRVSIAATTFHHERRKRRGTR